MLSSGLRRTPLKQFLGCSKGRRGLPGVATYFSFGEVSQFLCRRAAGICPPVNERNSKRLHSPATSSVASATRGYTSIRKG